MHGTAGQIQPPEVRAAVGWLEGTIQPAVAGEAVDGAVEHAIAVVYVLRGKPALDLDPHLDVIEPGGRLELLEDGLAIAGIERFPVMMRPEIWGVDQHVEGLAAGRCDIGLGVGRGTDITRRVRGWFSLAVDDVELFLGITREDEIMMPKPVKTAGQGQKKGQAPTSRPISAGVFETGWPRGDG